MNLNLSKFKKIAADKEKTTLKHEDGHTITVVHKALHPKIREQLVRLELAEGGEVQNPKLEQSKKMTPKTPVKRPETENETQSLVDDTKDDDLAREVMKEPRRMAEGGEADADEQLPSVGALNLDQAPNMAGAQLSGANDQEIPLPTQAQELATKYPIPEEDIKAAIPSTAAPVGSPVASAQPQATPPAAIADNVAPKPPEAATPGATPTIQGAYDKEKSAIGAQAKAISDAAKEQGKIEQDAASKDATDLANYQKHYQALQDETAHFTKDVQDGHIDPDRYLKNLTTGGKVSTIVGLLLGGVGQGLMHGQENPVMKTINGLIERDIDSQKAELGKKENLLSVNLRQYGNLQDATNMTRLMASSIVANKIKASMARSQDPLAQANGQKALADLDAQMAPTFQQMAMRQALMKDGGAHDPAEYVRHVVPEPHQAAVFKEIERAQNTRGMAGNIMQAFDQATKENTVMKTGAGLLRTPASVMALHQHLQPTFADLEGTVRQAAMDNTFHNITPAPGDSQHTIDVKRNALQEYLKSKASAPTAKGFGIDLDKFKSTAPIQAPAEIKTFNGAQYRKVAGGWQKVQQ